MDTEYSEDTHDTTAELDTTQIFNIRDLVNNNMEVTEGVQIRSRDVVSYVLLKWDSTVDRNWTVPDPQLFHDLVNRVESRVMELKLQCGDVLKWTNLWGKVGLLGLSIKNHALLTEFRELIEKQMTGTIKFSIYPRDALEKKGNVSVLLRETYRGLDVTQLPRSIFRRTRQLRGGLKVTHVKHYGDHERSRTGAPKKGWRLVLLQGDEEFMHSLEKFEPEHRFWVGSDRIIIRGGKRKAPAGNNTTGPQRPILGNPGRHATAGSRQLQWQGLEQQQQQSGQRQQQQHNTSHRGRSGTRENDRELPGSSGGGASRRGTGAGSRSADARGGVPVWGEAPHTRGGST